MLRQVSSLLGKSVLPLGSETCAIDLSSTSLRHAYTVFRSFAADPNALQAQPLTAAFNSLSQKLLKDNTIPFEATQANKTALLSLKDFILSLRQQDSYPKAQMKNLKFTVRVNHDLLTVSCQLKTTGGDCSKLVQQRLSELLAQCGLNPNFYFDGDEFKPKLAPLRRKILHKPNPTAAEPTPEAVAQARTQALKAGVPSQTITQQQFEEMERKQQEIKEDKESVSEAVDSLAADLQKLEPLLKAVAAVPWLLSKDDDDENQQRAVVIQTQVMDHLESWEWNIRGPVMKIWAGERDEKKLIKGKEGGTAAAVQTILLHAKQFDKELGLETYQKKKMKD